MSAGGAFRPGLLSASEEGSKFGCLSVTVETGRVRLGAWPWSGKVRAQTQCPGAIAHYPFQRPRFGLISISNIDGLLEDRVTSALR